MAKRKKRKHQRREHQASRAYEAAMNHPHRRNVVGADGSQDYAADSAQEQIRNWGRYLDENHDTASGLLSELVKSSIGTGIVTIPTPMNLDGSINEPLGEQIIREWKRWIRAVDVTGELAWSEAQRLIGRGAFRDGEYFLQHVQGRLANYPFTNMQVPYRLELLESDFVPMELSNDDGWRQGIRRNQWKQPLEYAVYLEHPGDLFVGGGFNRSFTMQDFKRVPAERMTHYKMATRWPSTRGISVLAPIVARLYDIKDLEESERIKNRNLSNWVAAIIKSPELIGHESTNESGKRSFDTFQGMLIDTLAVGESIEGVGPEYPIANMPEHIADQHRRLAAGTNTRYSSIAKRYDGNYAAQRQEMVESEGHYKIRTDAFVNKVVRPVYERWLMTAWLDGKVAIPPAMPFDLAASAEYRGPVTPWIDPWREVNADVAAIEAGIDDIDAVRIRRGAPERLIGQPAPITTAGRAPRQTVVRGDGPAQLSLISDDEDAA